MCIYIYTFIYVYIYLVKTSGRGEECGPGATPTVSTQRVYVKSDNPSKFKAAEDTVLSLLYIVYTRFLGSSN